MIRSGLRAGSGREALAAAHVVTCEGVRRERARRRRRWWWQCVRDACGGRSVARRCWERRGGERIPAEYPLAFLGPQPPARSPRAPSSAFLLQPVEALEMNFAISSEMTQVTHCTRAPPEEEGGVGRWWW